jgi:hypothetical protein
MTIDDEIFNKTSKYTLVSIFISTSIRDLLDLAPILVLNLPKPFSLNTWIDSKSGNFLVDTVSQIKESNS